MFFQVWAWLQVHTGVSGYSIVWGVQHSWAVLWETLYNPRLRASTHSRPPTQPASVLCCRHLVTFGEMYLTGSSFRLVYHSKDLRCTRYQIWRSAHICRKRYADICRHFTSNNKKAVLFGENTVGSENWFTGYFSVSTIFKSTSIKKNCKQHHWMPLTRWLVGLRQSGNDVPVLLGKHGCEYKSPTTHKEKKKNFFFAESLVVSSFAG